MALLKIKAFDAGPQSSGFSISQGESRGKTFFRLGMTTKAQKEYFGRPLDLKKDAIKLIVNDEPKHHHLMGIRVVDVDDPSGIALSGGARGSVFAKLATWRSAEGKRSAASLVVVNSKVRDGGVSVMLPEWARPTPDRSASVR